jgi:hypothetical protein
VYKSAAAHWDWALCVGQLGEWVSSGKGNGDACFVAR